MGFMERRVELKMAKKKELLSRREKKQHIINIATQVFAKKGYEGARVEEIAAKAGISKWNLYYYAGDKETLYSYVLDDLLTGVMEDMDINLDSDQSPEESMRAFIRGMGKGATYTPLHSIVLREMFSGGKYLPDKILKAVDRGVTICKQILAKGKKQGTFKEVNPFVVFMTIFGFLHYYQINIPHIHKAGLIQQYIGDLGPTVSDKVIKELEKVVFDHILAEK